MTGGDRNGVRVLVAGVGNIFLGDDAFGVEVAQRLARRRLPDGVRVVDFGIRGLDLVYALLDDYEAVVLVDAAPRGGPPGTLYVLEPESGEAPGPDGGGLMADPHSLHPANVLRLVAALGGRVRRLLVVACEPGACGDVEEMSAGLSAPVRAAADEAVPLIESLVTKLLQGGGEALTAGAEVR
jgi:hydrogenase maturation protease